MKSPFRLLGPLLAGVACLGLPACLNLKPARETARYFLLTPMSPAAPDHAPTPLHPAALGLGKVQLPAHLLRDNLAVRQGPTEIAYLENARWAERLDNGLQRTLAADLAQLLGANRMRLSAWARSEVQCEIYVSVERFDVDAQGQGTLSAWWRILAPGGGQTLQAGHFEHSRKGVAPAPDPAAAVATLSLLAEDLSRELANVVEKLAAPGAVIIQAEGPSVIILAESPSVYSPA